MAGRHFVCSDVHLGLPGSERDFFYQSFIPEIKSGDTLILLGDILDYWISAREIHLKTVIRNWRDLYECLRDLRNNNVKIKYVPGNHDSFVFYTECGDVEDFYWSDWLFDVCSTFRTLRNETRDYRLSTICDIHYPFFRSVIGSRTILFTHGHWIDLTWRILAGDVGRLVEERPLAKFWVVAKALNTCLVHRYAAEIRRVFTRYLDHEDIFELTRRTEDISYCILAEFLGNNAAGPWAGNNVESQDAPDEPMMRGAYEWMAQRFEEYLRDLRIEALRGPETEELRGPETRDRRACREQGRKLVEEWLRDDPPTAQLDRVRRVLLNNTAAYNYSLYREGRSTKVKYTALSELADFDVFVFGHFHKPRAGQLSFDDGCMLTNPKNKKVQTFLLIEPDGRIAASWAPDVSVRRGVSARFQNTIRRFLGRMRR